MNIKITYETLFEILRREKNREELQKLDDNFFLDLIEYLKEKENLIIRQKNSPDLFSFEDRKNEDQFMNIKKIIIDLYERREKKIINIAMNKSRTNSSIIDSSSLLPEEKKMFDELVENLNKYRLSILNKLLQSQLPNFEERKIENIDKTEEKKEEIKEGKNKVVRFIHAVPRFVGPELDIFGPFEADEIATLPEEIVNVLVEKKRAEEIKSE